MLPTRLKISLGKTVKSSFPYFSASLGPLMAIAGGGGASKSGVPNLIEIYQNEQLLVSYDFGDECTFYVQPHDTFLFVAGQRHLSCL